MKKTLTALNVLPLHTFIQEAEHINKKKTTAPIQKSMLINAYDVTYLQVNVLYTDPNLYSNTI